MKAKDKVLKIRPDAYCNPTFQPWGCQILAGGGDSRVALSNSQSRESWAWAEAFRNIKLKK